MAHTAIRMVDGKLACALEGHFDTLESQKLDALLKEHLTESQAVVFDMKGVTYICSAFLRVFMYVAKTAGSGNFTVADISPQVKRVFMSAGLGEILNEE